jgi:hypothetical protein
MSLLQLRITTIDYHPWYCIVKHSTYSCRSYTISQSDSDTQSCGHQDSLTSPQQVRLFIANQIKICQLFCSEDTGIPTNLRQRLENCQEERQVRNRSLSSQPQRQSFRLHLLFYRRFKSLQKRLVAYFEPLTPVDTCQSHALLVF